jgi:flagellar biosynthetic protein FliR
MPFTPLIRFGLLLVRPGMLIASAPPFGDNYAPQLTRVGLTALIALLLMPMVAVPDSLPLVSLVLAVVHETAIGLALGLSIRALLTGAEFAGSLSGLQIGFSYGSVVDPQSGVRNNMLASLYGNLALFTFFASNGHHAVMRALVGSYGALPIGGAHVDASLVRAVIDMLGVIFVLGVRLALPLMIVLLVMELALGLISRAAPGINLMVIGMPLRVIIGLMVVATLIPVAPTVVRGFIERALAAGVHAAQAFR